MLKSSNLIEKIISLLRKDPKQQFQQLAKKLRVNRTFLADSISALKNEKKLDRER
jgi:DNA-binding Lrp family transcriptional regulator